MAAKLAAEAGVPATSALKVVDRVFASIVDSLETDGRIELRNFGIFEAVVRKERMARNPRTGERVLVPAKRAVKFTPGMEMSRKVEESFGGVDLTKAEPVEV